MYLAVTHYGLRLPRFVAASIVCVTALLVGITLLPPEAFGSPPPGLAEVPDEDDLEALLAGDSDRDGDLDRPDPVSAAIAARESDERVEIMELRTPESRTFANPDGSHTVEDFGEPVRVETEDGWVDVDYEFTENTDGSFSPKASAVDVVVGADQREVARVTFADGESVAVTWPEDLGTPTVEGGVATYALSGAEDLLVVITGSGISVRLRLNEAPHAAAEPPADQSAEPEPESDGGLTDEAEGEDEPAIEEPATSTEVGGLEFSLGLSSDDLDLEQAADGSVRLLDGQELIGQSSTFMAWDARLDEAGDPLEVVELEAQLDPAAGGDAELTVTTPMDFLLDEATEYPVIIDPDISSLGRTRDTWLREGTSTNNSASYRLLVGRSVGATNTNQTISYLKFNTAPILGKDIVRAELGLYQYEAGSCSPRTMRIQPVNGTWNSNVTWATRPAYRSSTGHDRNVTHNPGGNGCSTGNGWVKGNVTGMVNAWAQGTYPDHGLRLIVPSVNANDQTYHRRFCSQNPDASTSMCHVASRRPYLSVTYNGPPNRAVTPTTNGRTWAGLFQVPTARPAWTSSAADPEGTQVRYYTEVHSSTSTSSSTLRASCNTGLVASGVSATCTPSASLVNGTTYHARTRARDSYGEYGAWSPWRTFRVDTSAVTAGAIACTGLEHDQWYDTSPVASAGCTLAYTGAAVDAEVKLNGSVVRRPSASGSLAALGEFEIPASGVTQIEARVRTAAGSVSGWSTFVVGTGSAGLSAPAVDERSSSTFPVVATGPGGASSAAVQWRHLPEVEDDTTTGWTAATDVVVTDTGVAWSGSVTGTSSMSRTPDLLWRPSAESGLELPAVLEVRAVFTYPGDATEHTEARRVTVVPHAFGGSFPVQDVGPSQVALFTGEMQISMTDVTVPGFAEELSFGRSHLSMAGPNSGPASIFGPGWIADLAGPDDAGVGGFSVIDLTASDGALVLQDPEGESYVYLHESETRGAQKTGYYFGLGETELEEDLLQLVAVTDTPGVTHRLTLTEWDGALTIWTRRTSGAWLVEQVVAPEENATTRYVHDASGQVEWIFAPAPEGIACTTATQDPGCRALRFTYDGTGAAKRLIEVQSRAYDPRPGADGLPGSGAGMAWTSVAKYSYDAERRLIASWDPRMGDGANALKTKYGYYPGTIPALGQRTVLAWAQEPGQVPWEFTFGILGDSAGKLVSIDRAQPTEIGGEDARWTVKYDLELDATGDGLPNLGAEATATWGQDGDDVPVGGTAVWEPDRIPETAPTVEDYEYASLSYYTRVGRTTNTAQFGAGAWQIDSTKYNAQGAEIWTLPAEARRVALQEADGDEALSPGLADTYASLTIYNDTGTRVEEQWGPTHHVLLKNGSWISGRTLTEYVYDDEADSVLMPGRPTTDVPDEGFGLVVEERNSFTTRPHPGAAGTEHDTTLTRYRYDPVVSGDGDGWGLKAATHTMVQNGSGWDTTITRFDEAGLEIQTRTPEGVATGQQTRWTNTVYYTLDGSASRAECRNKPQWVGQVCWSGPAAQPGSGHPVPAFSTLGYSSELQATRIAETSGAAKRTSTTEYDAAGRATASAVSTTGLATADVAVAATTTSYSPTTGDVTQVSDGVSTVMLTYDTWGRETSRDDGNGQVTSSEYDEAGRLVSADDGKGTYTYTYDGQDAQGRKERRGLVTKVDVGLDSDAEGVFTGAYDAAGNLIEQNYPGGIQAVSTFDINGTQQTLNYYQDEDLWFGYSQFHDDAERVRWSVNPLSQEVFSYDDRDRLVRVQDSYALTGCETREYAFTTDSNRTALTTYGPGPGGACQTSSVTSTASHTYDAADRITDLGYAYDQLGRTLTVPAAHTDQPAGGSLEVSYHANDMVAGLSQQVPAGTASVPWDQGFSLDVLGRLTGAEIAINGVKLRETTNYYDAADDAPAWTKTRVRGGASAPWETTWTRYVMGLGEAMALTEDSVGTVKVHLANPHGDIAAIHTLGGTGLDSYAEYTEYGLAKLHTPAPARYGWHGTKQRDNATVGGVTLMGVRLYNPITGRFLSRDPVAGGNDNTYIYPADPINLEDLDGKFFKKLKSGAKKVGKWANRNKGRIARGALRVASWTPHGRVVKYGIKAAKWSKKGISKLNNVRKNNNIIRVGPTTKGSPFRISIGAAPRSWKQLPAWRQRLQTRHYHFERARGGITNHRTGNSRRLWGNWR